MIVRDTYHATKQTKDSAGYMGRIELDASVLFGKEPDDGSSGR